MGAIARRTAFVVAVCAAVGATIAIRGQSATKNGEWPTYGADLANTHYSPLEQITSTNFSKLEIAWRFKTDNLGPRPEFSYEGTPLMVKGVLYSTAGSRRSVVALNATTGELLWVHMEDEGERGASAPRQLSGRGLAYWTDGRQERILYVTPGYRLVALDAKTGALANGFGVGGVVDLKLDDDQAIDLIHSDIGYQSAPVVAKDVVIVGASHATGGNPKSFRNVKGYARGFDVRTGKRLWIFHTIPRPGEFGNETWLNDSWAYTGNAGIWGQISVDEELETVYLPVELPTGDYFGAHRPGAGLFGESIVAVDLHTGKRKWHFQLVHHGLWDMDIPCAPILTDITVNGRAVKALAQPTKQAFLYVFDRVTGQPIWPIEERPAPPGDVPGEWYSPTQPIPLNSHGQPFNYDRQGSSVDDLIDFTPELRAQAVQLTTKYKMGPVFTPPIVSKAEGPLAVLAMATSGGGTNWPGGSYDPVTHVLYVYSQASMGTLNLVPPLPGQSDMEFIQGNAASGPRTSGGSGSQAGASRTPAPTPAAGGRAASASIAPAARGRGASDSPAAAGGEGGGGGLTVQGLPLNKPPYGQMSAINLDKGEIQWQVAHGETPDNIRNNPALKGLEIPRTGQRGNIGTLVTKTLVIAGDAQVTTTSTHPRGAMLRAYDKATGKEMGAVLMPAQQSGTPMTYALNGTQFLVVAISGGAYSGELLAFRLPAEARQ